ncbi:MAG: hypothetical protein WAL90_16415, partial [Desulfobacterales bacterium]
MRHLKSIATAMALVVCMVFGVCTSSWAQSAKAWTNLGLYGGWVYDIAVDPGRADRMFASTYMGEGLFKTEDGGRTWSV